MQRHGWTIPSPASFRAGPALALLVAAVLLAAPASGAHAASAQQYDAAIKLSFDFSIRTELNGKDPTLTCPAPYETFVSTYHQEFTTAAGSQKSRTGAVGLRPDGFAYTLVRKRGFTEFGESGGWDLVLANTDPSCGPPPTGQTLSSPTCRRLSGGMVVSMGPAAKSGRGRDGVLQLDGVGGGGPLQTQCYRVLPTAVYFPDEREAWINPIGAGMKFRIPVKNLRGKLARLAKGERSFSFSSAISGSCGTATIRPGFGGGDDLAGIPSGRQLIGSGRSYRCAVKGTLTATVSRVGRVQTVKLF